MNTATTSLWKEHKGYRVSIHGCDIYTIDEGEGQPILFLHGNPDSADIWHYQIAEFSKAYRCVAPDFPGYGRSKIADDFEFSLENYIAYMNALVDALSISLPVHVVLHDIGGIYGLPWAVTHPEKLASLTIMNTVFSPEYRWHFWGRVWRTWILGEISMALNSPALMAKELHRGSRKLSKEHIDTTCEQYSSLAKRTTLKLYRQADPELIRSWQPKLQTFTASVPTKILWGKHDPYIDERFAQLFYTDDVVIFEESGHWVQAECYEAVNAALTMHFNQH